MFEEVKRNHRKPNWTKDEQKALLTAISPMYTKLFGRFSSSTTNEGKAAIWDTVYEEVSICFISQSTRMHTMYSTSLTFD